MMAVSFNQIPRDVQLLVFSYLRPEELGRYSRVCKIWYALANTESLWRALPLPSIAFGKKEWEKYLGDVGEEPPLPKEVYKVLKSSCPFLTRWRVEETHLLTLIPKTVNGQPLTLDSLEQLMKHPKHGRRQRYVYYSDEIKKEYGSKSLLKSTWVLLTKYGIPGSKGKNFAAQVQLLEEISQKVGMAYEVPKLLETATSIFVEYQREGKRCYSDTFTWCQESVSREFNFTTGIGNFDMNGFWIGIVNTNRGEYELAGMRKF